MSGMKRAWKWAVLLAVLAAPWLRGLTYPFLYDDLGMIAENPFLEDPANLAPVLAGRTLADPHVVNGRRPAVLATYFFDRAVYGLLPAGWRITNLLLHLGCVALWMVLLRRLGCRDFQVAAAGVLFGLHPVLVEVVHAPGFRADVLCLLFVLLALHGFLGSGRHPVLSRLGGAVCLVLALLSKETALAAPVALGGLGMLYPEAFAGGRRTRGVWLAAAIGIAAGFFALWLWLPAELQTAGRAWNGESLKFPQTVYSAPALWTRSLRLLLVPWPLNVTPAFAPVPSGVSPRFWAGVFWLAAGGWGAWRARRAAPAVALGLLWMLAFFLPVANVVPLLHPAADRYLYPLAPGFALAAGWLLAQQSRRGRGLGLGALAAVYVLLLTLRLCQWASAEKLWSAAYFQNPRSATAATWLGLLRAEAGDADGARAFYRAAVEANPQAGKAWCNWGVLEGQAGNLVESERLLRQAVAVRPEGADGWHNLAVCLEKQGRKAESAAAVARAAELAGAYGRVKP